MFIFKNRLALITGSSGFIGYHVTKKLLEQDWKVIALIICRIITMYHLKKTARNTETI